MFLSHGWPPSWRGRGTEGHIAHCLIASPMSLSLSVPAGVYLHICTTYTHATTSHASHSPPTNTNCLTRHFPMCCPFPCFLVPELHTHLPTHQPFCGEAVSRIASRLPCRVGIGHSLILIHSQNVSSKARAGRLRGRERKHGVSCRA